MLRNRFIEPAPETTAMKTKPSSRNWILGAILTAHVGLSTSSQAAVTVTFEQVGANVVATWNGSLNFGAEKTYPWLVAAAARADSKSMISGFNGAVDIWSGGTFQTTSLTLSMANNRTPAAAEWGFSETDFILGPGLSTPGLTMIDFGTGSDYTLTWDDLTLASMGAGAFNNTLAWTSAAGDTISYTTVPEPGTAALLVMGALGLITRRRNGRMRN